MADLTILDRLTRAGLRLWLDGGDLCFETERGASAEQVGWLKAHKADIVRALRAAELKRAGDGLLCSLERYGFGLSREGKTLYVTLPDDFQPDADGTEAAAWIAGQFAALESAWPEWRGALGKPKPEPEQREPEQRGGGWKAHGLWGKSAHLYEGNDQPVEMLRPGWAARVDLAGGILKKSS